VWDIFCKVIDNHGDVGVCWRLASQLARRGEQVRLWVDEPSALAWMAPGGQAGVQVIRWTADAQPVGPGDAVVEAFGCDLDDAFVAALARKSRSEGRQPAWINLEYLTAQAFAQRNHGLPSPVLSGPGAGLAKRFFYPGFTGGTGGLLREPDLAARQAAFEPHAWLRGQGIEPDGARLASLFCYEPQALGLVLELLARGPAPTRLLVTAGRATAAVRAVLGREKGPQPASSLRGMLSISYLPLLSQADYDHLLWACDLNFVRGEDSLVRALWAGKPLVWQIYPQDDNAHHAKLSAFLDWLHAPPSLRQFHHAWNGIGGQPPPAPDLPVWTTAVAAARTRLLGQPDLTTQLMEMAHPQRRP
jgi:uncharacterized repeat protein (TIGR03837 family)